MATTILVVDDDPAPREFLVKTLQDAGYEARGCGPDEALGWLGKGRIGLVIADVRLALSKEGTSPVGTLKQARPKLRCILVAPYDEEDALGLAIGFPVDCFVFRPLRVPAVLDSVRRLIGPGGSGGLWGKIMALPGQIFKRGERERCALAWQSLASERSRSLAGFYQGVREGSLSRGAALDCWDRLALLEERFVGVTEGSPALELAKLAREFEEVVKLQEALIKARSDGSFRSRPTSLVDRASFQRFFERIQSGRISPERIKDAWKAWSAGPKASQDLRLVRKAMWEEAAAPAPAAPFQASSPPAREPELTAPSQPPPGLPPAAPFRPTPPSDSPGPASQPVLLSRPSRQVAPPRPTFLSGGAAEEEPEPPLRGAEASPGLEALEAQGPAAPPAPRPPAAPVPSAPPAGSAPRPAAWWPGAGASGGPPSTPAGASALFSPVPGPSASVPARPPAPPAPAGPPAVPAPARAGPPVAPASTPARPAVPAPDRAGPPAMPAPPQARPPAMPTSNPARPPAVPAPTPVGPPAMPAPPQARPPAMPTSPPVRPPVGPAPTPAGPPVGPAPTPAGPTVPVPARHAQPGPGAEFAPVPGARSPFTGRPVTPQPAQDQRPVPGPPPTPPPRTGPPPAPPPSPAPSGPLRARLRAPSHGLLPPPPESLDEGPSADFQASWPPP